MRRYGLYDTTRGLMTALAVGVAGLLLWVATQVGQQSAARFWEEMGIVAAAGLALTLLPALGSSHSGLRLRLSPGAFLLGFLPAFVVVGWILMATQPGHGWHEGTLVSWSHNLGIMGAVHSIGLWHGVLAFGLGAVLGMSFDAVPAVVPADEVVVDRRRDRVATTGAAAAGPAAMSRAPMRGRPASNTPAADEPVTAERDATANDGATTARPRRVPVGPFGRRSRVDEEE
jgi:hypothetical protein